MGRPDEEIELGPDDCDVVFYDGQAIDLGEAIADTLALAMQPYPRSPGAEAALKQAKTHGERYLFFKRNMTDAIAGKVTLENQLRQALVVGRLDVMVVQPGQFFGIELGGGRGQVRMQQGFFSVQQTCPSCHGRGTVISDPCKSCHGQGRVEETKTLSVKVPAGVDTGDRIRLSGEGEAGADGGPSGDLYVQVHVREHNIFKRDGADLYCEVPIDFVDAALGGELEVPTLDGRVKLKVPAETQTGKLFKLRGKGVTPVRGGGVGDLLCRVVVETPVNLTGKQKDLLREFQTTMKGGKYSPKQSSWFDGVKKFFNE